MTDPVDLIRGFPAHGGVPEQAGPISFMVPPRMLWRLEIINVDMVTSGVNGQRHIVIEIAEDDDSLIAVLGNPAVNQESSSTQLWQWGAGLAYSGASAKRGGESFVTAPLPTGLLLHTDSKILIYDSAAIDEAGDLLSVYATVTQFPTS